MRKKMAWMIPIIPNRRNRSAHHKIGGLISLILLFLGLGVFFFGFLSYSKFDGFAIHSIWIIGGIVFLLSIFVIVGIIAAVASVNSKTVKINGYKENPYQSKNESPKKNPYIFRSPVQVNQEALLFDKPESTIPVHQEIQYCRYCGEKLEKDAKFCHQCGIKIKK